MKFITHSILWLCLLIGTNVLAGYRIISLDIKVNADDIRIQFSPSLYKEEATITYRRCSDCPWQDRVVTKNTEYMVKGLNVTFPDFKKAVLSYTANPPSKGYKVYLSNDTRNNEIFAIEWDIAG